MSDTLYHIAAARLRRTRQPRHDREFTLEAIDAIERQDADDLARGIRIAIAQSRGFVNTMPSVRSPACESAERNDSRTPLFWPAIGVLAFLGAVGCAIALLAS